MSEKRRYPAPTAPTKLSGTVQMKRKNDSRRDVDLEMLPNVKKVDQTTAGDVFHLTTGARVVSLLHLLLKCFFSLSHHLTGPSYFTSEACATHLQRRHQASC